MKNENNLVWLAPEQRRVLLSVKPQPKPKIDWLFFGFWVSYLGFFIWIGVQLWEWL